MRIYLILLVTSLNLFCSNEAESSNNSESLKQIQNQFEAGTGQIRLVALIEKYKRGADPKSLIPDLEDLLKVSNTLFVEAIKRMRI